MQNSTDDYRKSLRRLKKIPQEIEQVIQLLKQGVKVISVVKKKNWFQYLYFSMTAKIAKLSYNYWL